MNVTTFERLEPKLKKKVIQNSDVHWGLNIYWTVKHVVTGKPENVFFAFDIINDTAIDVATEMVNELEISDWDPLEIAMMIKKEISTLIPNWEVWNLPKNHHQHSFNYEEDDDDNDNDNDDDENINVIPHPFYSCSSHESSSNSLQDFYSFYDNNSHNHCGEMKETSTTTEWFQGTILSLISFMIFSLFVKISKFVFEVLVIVFI